MKRCIIPAFVVVLLVLAMGCSSGSGQAPVQPASEPPTGSSEDSHSLWGLYQFTIDPATKNLECTALRSAGFHLNALPFLEPPPFVNLTLESVAFVGNFVEADIGLRHPFLGLTEFTGFDVCGILISDGSISGFTDPDLLLPGPDDLHLANPDGFTRWWNPAEFPVNTGTINSYNDGLLGTPDAIADFTATLNGYKYFCDELLTPDAPLSDIDPASRGVFSAGKKNVRHYSIDLGTAGLVFNYAIDANWQFPTGGSPWTVPDDFPEGANRKEAWNIEIHIDDNTLWNDGVDSGGDLDLTITLYDWFSPDLNLLTVESPGNFDAVIDVAPTGVGPGSVTFQVEITDATPAEDSIDLLITAKCEASGYGGLLPGKAQAIYFTAQVPVGDESPTHTINLVDVTPPGWPAILQDVWIDGDYAYCVGGQGGLLILDVSGSGDPEYVGGYITDGGGYEVQVEEDYAYIADGSSGLEIFDVSDPSNPDPAASYPTGYDIPGLFVTDGYCYAANGKGGVHILDVGGGTQGGSPENPQLEGTFSVGYAALDIFVVDGIAYVSDYETRFLVIDVGGGTHGGSPANPQWEGEIAPFNPDEIFVAGNYAYVCDQNNQRFYTIDISDPAKPALADTDYTTWDVMDVWVDGSYLYTSQSNDGMVVYSLANPANPGYAGSYNTPGHAFGVCKSGNEAYVADYYYGLRVLDASSPGSPSNIGRYFTPSHITDVQVDGGYVYTADGTCGLAVVDVGGGSASPTEPLTLVRWTQPSGDTDARGVWVEDGYAYLGGGFSNFHLTIADVGAGSGSPGSPIAVGDYYSGGNRLYGMQKMDKYLYVAAYTINGGPSGGLEVFDVDGGVMGGSPSSPKLAASYSLNTAWELWAEDGYVYVSNGTSASGLYVFDVGGGTGAPNAPKLADSYITQPESLYDVNVGSGYAYCVGTGLTVFDVGGSIGAPDDIQKVGAYVYPHLTRGVGFHEDVVYMVPGQSVSSLIALDVGGAGIGGTPEIPLFVDSVDFPSGCDAFCVAFSGQYAYVGTHSQGLRIVQLWQ